MKRILFAILLFVALVPSVFAVDDPCDRPEWHKRTRALLVRLFPNDETAKNIQIGFLCDPVPNAHHGSFGLLISTGLLSLKNDEYAAVLAHEMGHEKLNQPPAIGFDWFHMVEDLSQLEKNEEEADDFSLVALKRAGFEICAAQRAFEFALNFTTIYDNPNGPHNQILLRRLTRLQAACKESSSKGDQK